MRLIHRFVLLLIFIAIFSTAIYGFAKRNEFAPGSEKFNGWKGNVTGDSCKKNSDCGDCGSKGTGAPGGLLCMCLPELKKCGFGHPEWLQEAVQK